MLVVWARGEGLNGVFKGKLCQGFPQINDQFVKFAFSFVLGYLLLGIVCEALCNIFICLLVTVTTCGSLFYVVLVLSTARLVFLVSFCAWVVLFELYIVFIFAVGSWNSHAQEFQTILLSDLSDITIFSSSLEQHLQQLGLVLARLTEHNLNLKLQKSEASYLGHAISASGVMTLLASAHWLNRPYWEYLNGAGQGFTGNNWSEECENAVPTLKWPLQSAPFLGYAEFTKLFLLEIDSCHTGLVAGPGWKETTTCICKQEPQNHRKQALAPNFREHLPGNKFVVFG